MLAAALLLEKPVSLAMQSAKVEAWREICFFVVIMNFITENLT